MRSVVLGVLCLLAGVGRAGLDFTEAGKEYHFDTGSLHGVLRAGGKSFGIGPVIDTRSGVTVAGMLGLFGPYRLLDADKRYLPDARDWPSTSRRLPDTGVEVRWQADAEHPFDLEIVYRWASTNALDAMITVTAHQPLRRFEVFLASYFQGFPAVYGYGLHGFVEIKKEMGDWLSFPRDSAAETIIADGRWLRPPHPVTFKPVARYAGALGIRRDAASGLTGLVMAPPDECFAVLMPHGEDGHRSLYLSLFGRDFNDGEKATARARLVIGHDVTDKQAIEGYEAYLKEIKP